MRLLNPLCLFSLFSDSISRVITIEEFGGKLVICISHRLLSYNRNQLNSGVSIFLTSSFALHKQYCTAQIPNTAGKPDSQINIEKEPVHHPEFLHSSQKNYPSSHDLTRIKHHGAKDKDDDLIQQAMINTKAYNLALIAANQGDRLLLYENESYTFMGGIQGVHLRNIVLDFAGYTRFVYDLDNWPMRNYTGGSGGGMEDEYVPAIDLLDCSGIIITCSATKKAIVSVDYEKNEIYMDTESGSGGIIDGHGKRWWDSAILGDIVVESRPRLIDVRGSMNITVEYITLVNSPYWTLTLEAIGAEVQYVNVLVDRNYQRQLINNTMLDSFRESDSPNLQEGGGTVQESRRLRGNEPSLNFHFPDIIPSWILQPQNLNTDGIDPIGQDIYIHDCIVLNDDDSVAVKPPRHGGPGSVMNGTILYECTSNITIENMVLTGFGASVGSVGPSQSNPCVDNVTFKNIKMPGTGKGIYIKSNKSDCKGNITSRITNIV